MLCDATVHNMTPCLSYVQLISVYEKSFTEATAVNFLLENSSFSRCDLDQHVSYLVIIPTCNNTVPTKLKVH